MASTGGPLVAGVVCVCVFLFWLLRVAGLLQPRVVLLCCYTVAMLYQLMCNFLADLDSWSQQCGICTGHLIIR